MLLKGIEILAAGEWPASERLRLNEDDLDSIVSAFNTLGMAGRVPLKLGHDGPDARDDPSSQYAMGWVQRVWREGKKMLADFDVPQRVYNAIKEKMLKFNSVELLKDVQAGNRQIPYVLDAVAMLGADQPAVGVLKEMQASLMARRSFLRSGGRVTLTRNGSKSEGKSVDENEVKKLIEAGMKPLQDQLKVATDAVTAANARADAAEKTAKEQAVKYKRAQIDERFNAAIEAKTLEPAKRESFVKLTKYDKDDASAMSLELSEVDAFIKDNSKEPPKKTTATQQGEGSADDEAGLRPDQVVALRTRKAIIASRGNPADPKQWQKATVEVLKNDKKLADAYKNADLTTEASA